MPYHQFGHFNTNINNNVSIKSGSGVVGWFWSAFLRPLPSAFEKYLSLYFTVPYPSTSQDRSPQFLTTSGHNQDLVKIRDMSRLSPRSDELCLWILFQSDDPNSQDQALVIWDLVDQMASVLGSVVGPYNKYTVLV